ncbi:hypothetical protein AB0J85_26500, partial [Micromonospora echinofusca]|uniref:hypothetical protein n=1 Tax=Micromonospora echinofusca TaxID=47858 RepID=UPI00341C04C1
MTGYLAALAALAVGAAPRLRPRTLGRFEPEQPQAGVDIAAYDVEQSTPTPSRPAARPAVAGASGAARMAVGHEDGRPVPSW